MLSFTGWSGVLASQARSVEIILQLLMVSKSAR